MSDPLANRWLTVEQASKQLSVHPETVRRAYRRGELAGRRNRLAPGGPLLFSQADINAFARARTGCPA